MSTPQAKPVVGVIKGSKSDWETMRLAAEVLAQFGVPHESQIVSAPDAGWMCEYARGRPRAAGSR
jgi:5-(carboxyamino)imidazole ribonucleotide mutase